LGEISDIVRCGDTHHIEFSIHRDEMQAFREISGDKNPIHWDSSVARKAGLRGPAVYGALIIAKLSRLIGSELPGHYAIWTELSTRFHNPLGVNENADIHATVTHVSDATQVIELRYEVRSDTKTIARGTASVIIGLND
jgi:3-hydroxybutyryl-CoA dehydratase